MMFNDPMDAVMALAQQLKESKIGGTGLTPEGKDYGHFLISVSPTNTRKNSLY